MSDQTTLRLMTLGVAIVITTLLRLVAKDDT